MPLRPALAGVAVVVAVLASQVAPVRAVAADVAFGTGTAEATFGEGIEFSIPVTLPADADRVELLLEFPDSLGPQVIDIPVPERSPTTLRHRWDLGEDGILVPNTTMTARWRVTIPGEQAVSSPTRVTFADTRFSWRTVEGDVVRVHWYAGSDAFGRRALEIGEQAVSETAALLGVTEDEPIDFFIYPEEAAFREALGPGTRENVGGQAHAGIRTLFALIPPGEIDAAWVGVVIPHELVHLVFDTTVDNPYRFPPRWLNEGLAVYLSEGYDAGDRGQVEEAAAGGTLMPLSALTGQFPTTFDRFALAYAESVAAVDYLVRAHGRDALLDLVRSYREGLTDAEAFERAIGQDVEAFEAGWFDELGAEDPIRYGPQPAAPGPVPSGWTGAAATPMPGLSSGEPGAPPVSPTTGVPGSGVADSESPVVPIVAILVVVGVLGVAIAAIALRRRQGREPA